MQVFRGSEQSHDVMVDALEEIAARYEPIDAAGSPEVPYLADFRIALNVASCDNQPLVVVQTDSDARAAQAERHLAPLAWDPAFRGRFAFVHVTDPTEMEALGDAPEAGNAVMIVQPGIFGLEGTVIARTTKLTESALGDLTGVLTPWGPFTLVTVALGTVATFACLIPAVRASTIRPARALGSDM